MGLAAGGKMTQDIVGDNNPADIWNATLLNVHILDPASYDQATHIVQEPPMDAQASRRTSKTGWIKATLAK